MSFNKKYVSMDIIPTIIESEDRFKNYYNSDALIFRDKESEYYFDLYREGYTIKILKLYYESQKHRKLIS
jgi:hypothetical protein